MNVTQARGVLDQLDRTVAAQGPDALWVQSANAIRFLLSQVESAVPTQHRDEDDIEYLDRMRRERPDLSLDDLGFVNTRPASTEPAGFRLAVSAPPTITDETRHAIKWAVWGALEPRLEDHVRLDLNDGQDYAQFEQMVDSVADAALRAALGGEEKTHE